MVTQCPQVRCVSVLLVIFTMAAVASVAPMTCFTTVDYVVHVGAMTDVFTVATMASVVAVASVASMVAVASMVTVASMASMVTVTSMVAVAVVAMTVAVSVTIVDMAFVIVAVVVVCSGVSESIGRSGGERTCVAMELRIGDSTRIQSADSSREKG